MRIIFPTIALLLAACSNGAHFTTQTAPGFTPAPHTVSVLGVYKDGRMAVDVWDKLAPHLAEALASAKCDVGFDSLMASNQELANAIDESTRDEGPNSELFTRLAPAARGDLVLMLTLAGKPPEHEEQGQPPLGAPVNTSMTMPRKKSRHSTHGNGQAPNRLDVSAILFSASSNRPVVLVSMTYDGETMDDAMTRFGAELARAIPRSKCVGWNWDVKIDPATLHSNVAQ